MEEKSLSEANNWYQNDKATRIDVDASQIMVLDLENRDIVLGKDYLIFGQVSLSSQGTIRPGYYNFERHGEGFFDGGYFGLRNAGTVIGGYCAGEGNPFHINFYNYPTILRPRR